MSENIGEFRELTERQQQRVWAVIDCILNNDWVPLIKYREIDAEMFFKNEVVTLSIFGSKNLGLASECWNSMKDSPAIKNFVLAE